MPRFNDQDMENQTVHGTAFKFSTTRLDNLSASEYTLVTLVVDKSGSVDGFKADLEKALREIVMSCKHSPRADNLMIRLVSFNHDVAEEHGFKLLSQCNPDDYLGLLNCGGQTALYDSSYTALEVLKAEAKRLTDNNYDVNAVAFVITDGEDNHSSFRAEQVKQSIADAMKSESLKTLVTVLIGVGADPGVSGYLQKFKDEAGFTQFVNVGDATAKNLAKLAQFVSKSISASSTSLNTGSAPASLSF